MPRETSTIRRRGCRGNSFSLVELLTVIAIIAILAGITLAAAGPVMNMAARSRARAELKEMETALEGYKNDYGSYPMTNAFASTASYSATDGSSVGGPYEYSSQLVYQALSGKTNYNDTLVSGTRVYMNFRPSQLGNPKAAAGTTGSGSTYVQDPWGYSYGYSTGTGNGGTSTNYPNNGNGFFDLWSTGGWVASTVNPSSTTTTNSWVVNWQ